VLGVAGVLQTVPSIALLGFMIPLFGIGALPAVIALFLYALLPIIRNTATGIREVDPAVRESAWGMGLSGWQVLTQVELPLALPVLFAGIRTAAVINVGVATLAALIASGGLGESIFGGIALNNTAMILAGAIPAPGWPCCWIRGWPACNGSTCGGPNGPGAPPWSWRYCRPDGCCFRSRRSKPALRPNSW
jgi:osmoprotectant transport system permease protein